MADNITKQDIVNQISDIRNAEDPGSVTNVFVANVLSQIFSMMPLWPDIDGMVEPLKGICDGVSAWNAQLNIRDIRVSGGAVTGEAGWDCSGFIPLNRDFPVTVSYKDVGVPPTVSLFDIGKRHLSTPQLDPKSRSVPVAAMPAGAAYFVVCARRDCGATWTNSPTREGLMHGISTLIDRLDTHARSLDTALGSVRDRLSELSYVVDEEHDPAIELLGGNVGGLMTYVEHRGEFDGMWLMDVGYSGGIDRTGHPDAPYLLNGLWLTYQEALLSYATRRHLSLDNHGFYSGSYIRTNLLPNPRCGHFPYSRNCESLFNGCTYLEVARVSHSSTVFYNSLTRAFKGCTALHTVLGDIDLHAKPDVSEMFAGCAALETVSIVNLTQDISFADSPSLSTRSLRLLVNNAANTAPITITLHGSRYHDYICANGLPTSAGTPPVCTLIPASEMEDWKWLHAAMQEKQITFATAAA